MEKDERNFEVVLEDGRRFLSGYLLIILAVQQVRLRKTATPISRRSQRIGRKQEGEEKSDNERLRY